MSKKIIKINFLGGVDSVTGSKTLVQFHNYKFLVDCGLFQGDKNLRLRNREEFPIPPSEIDAVFLTHAHIDHSGYLPRLIKDGFKGPVYCTPGTLDLCRILLLDTAYLEEETARYANQSGYSNHKPALPLFDISDAEKSLRQLVPLERSQWHPIFKDAHVRFIRSGHIIGSSCVQFSFNVNDHMKIVTFSGDVGHERSFVMKGPESISETDVLVLESTYGHRLHPKIDVLGEFARIANHTFAEDGVLVIPAFAVGRAQEVMYLIRYAEEKKLIPKVPVILDSPMSAEALQIFMKHPDDHILSSKFSDVTGHLRPAKFEISVTSDESMLACMRDGPMVVISASGMLNGGRILHHLKRRLIEKSNTILFSGYQAEGTKGRYLQDHHSTGEMIRIHHREIPIYARVENLDSLSSHGDYQEMIRWIKNFASQPKKIFLNHGTLEGKEFFKNELIKNFKNLDIEIGEFGKDYSV